MIKSLLTIAITLFVSTISFPLFAAVTGTHISGSLSDNVFTGHADYTIDGSSDTSLFFHLPPNYQNCTDNREKYSYLDQQGTEKTIARSDLQYLQQYFHVNGNLAQSINITAVFVNNRQVPFSLHNNESLPPLSCEIDTLLKIDTQSPPDTIKIKFTTSFNDLEDQRVPILWDFAPRAVTQLNGIWDYHDAIKPMTSIKIDLESISGLDPEINQKHIMGRYSVPIAILSASEQSFPVFNVYNHQEELQESKFIAKRIQKVVDFLIDERWIPPPEEPMQFTFWDGPLANSGNIILLPQKLFRYPSIFYKRFEIEILKGVVFAQIRRNYLFNNNRNPWLQSAVSGEIIRDYINQVYDGNAAFFPWSQWINPNFYQENTLKHWLAVRPELTLIDAADHRYFRYDNRLYHPGYAKGFHLLPLLHQNKKESMIGIHDRLKNFLQPFPIQQRRFAIEDFFRIVAPDPNQRHLVEKWFSPEGRIDYAIENVIITPAPLKTHVALKIANQGTVNPPLDILFKNGSQSRIEQVFNGAGSYQFDLSFIPEQIYLDPSANLLEDERLNNSWDIPFKIRPFWDISSASQWLVTISPIIGGNAQDQNMAGLEFNLTYLNQTTFQIDAWQTEQSDETIWTGKFIQKDFPWKNATFSLSKSELNGGVSETIRLAHAFNTIGPNRNLASHYTKVVYENSETNNEDTWQVGGISANSPIFEGDSLQWTTAYSTSEGKLDDQEDVYFRENAFRQDMAWMMGNGDVHWGFKVNTSTGTLPQQRRHPIGGPEALAGFPWENDLLFEQRKIGEIGFKLPPFMTHTELNLLHSLWLERIQPTVNFHWATAQNGEQPEEIFKDIEFRFDFFGEFIRLYSASTSLAVGFPLGHEKYKDPRLVAFSSWVF